MTARVRCAIYTRKSTDEGLDQSFNSLDAQREACEAYIRSQAGEGWKLLPSRYDDGGYSGGNLDRPAMQQLLADVDAGKVDVIVVYKVDRLTRSLLDFAKVVERLDARGTSFVSVTQAFNTTTSMGRLTLNVLLSFAQFEREVTGERIRDKIAASKAKGMWMGGNVPFGYDLRERRLIVNPAEAETVRHIFSRYLELRSGVELMKELRSNGIVSKRWTSRSGQERGGLPFSCGALYYLLRNRIYLGEIVHRGVCHNGEHDAIVSPELFEAVQEDLAERRQKRRAEPKRSRECVLAGLVRGADGETMTSSFSYGRRGRLYRYYVAGSLNLSRRDRSSPPRRIPAAALERIVLESVAKVLGHEPGWAEVLSLVSAVDLYERSIHLLLSAAALSEPHERLDDVAERLRKNTEPHLLIADDRCLRLIIDRKPVFRRGKSADFGIAATPPNSDGAALLRKAHQLLEDHSMSPLFSGGYSNAQSPSWQRQRRIMALGLLAPTIQKSVLRGAFPIRADEVFAEPLPLAWADQAKSLI